MKWEILATICSVAIVQAHVGFKASVTDERFEDLWLRIEPYGSTQGFGTLVKSAGDRTNFKDPADEVDNLVLDGKKGLWVASVDSNNNNELVFNKQDWIREGGFSIGSERQLQVGKQFFWIFCHDKDDNKNHVYFEGEIGTIKNIPNNCARGVLTGHF
ncbi:hypothetical protein TRVA0_038S00826 [Trichomonascus vanleenenianus]|uniref:uncharacterized protein n=1 Tax=Trichomonascus vanleenenianus TaxID=2268995 RepID=UPI003ECA546F